MESFSGKSKTETPPASVDETLPASVDETLPASVHETLPASVHETLPASVHETLPASVHETLPASVDETLPVSDMSSYDSSLRSSTLENNLLGNDNISKTLNEGEHSVETVNYIDTLCGDEFIRNYFNKIENKSK